MQINQEKIEAAIIQEAADRIVEDRDIGALVQAEVIKRIDAIFATTAEEQIKRQVEIAIAKGFSHEYCKINSLGQKVGEPTTIGAELNNLIGGYWNTKVDRDGNPSSNYGNVTRAEWFMLKMAGESLGSEMKQHIVNIGGGLKDSLRKQFHGVVNQLLSEVFVVNSLEDQASRNTNCTKPTAEGKS
jgi:hypothetical protein